MRQNPIPEKKLYPTMLHSTKQLVILILAIFWLSGNSNADSNVDQIKNKLGEVFHRTMAHWNFDYNKLDETKVGVACIPGNDIDGAFLEGVIFEAIGFSYSMAKEDFAIRTAHQGCEQMARHYEVSDCTCQVVLIDNEVRAEVPTNFITGRKAE